MLDFGIKLRKPAWFDIIWQRCAKLCKILKICKNLIWFLAVSEEVSWRYFSLLIKKQASLGPLFFFFSCWISTTGQLLWTFTAPIMAMVAVCCLTALLLVDVLIEIRYLWKIRFMLVWYDYWTFSDFSRRPISYFSSCRYLLQWTESLSWNRGMLIASCVELILFFIKYVNLLHLCRPCHLHWLVHQFMNHPPGWCSVSCWGFGWFFRW